MAIVVQEFDDGWDHWDNLVRQSPAGTVFHNSSVLTAIEHSIDIKLHTYIGYKGQEPIGICPLFEKTKGPFSVIYSPIPESGVPFCGPILLNYDKLDRRKKDRLSKSFTDECLNILHENVGPKYVNLKLPPNYEDPRPFRWNGYNVSPLYTYTLDITIPTEDLLKSFTRDLRTNITDDYTESITIETGGHDAIEYVLNRIQERYEAQGRSLNLNSEFVHSLYDKCPEKNMQVYLGRVDGEIESGMIILQDSTTRYYWQGGGKPETALPLNDLIHWQVICDGKDNGIKYYDLVGANTARLIRYKAKFNPNMTGYHVATWDSPWSQIYKKVIQ